MRPESHWRPAVVVFCLVAGLLWWSVGDRLTWVNDEGIYLDGAERVLRGQVPYRDFFVLTGPGTFWLQAAAFRLFGVSLASAHVLLVADLALLAAGVFWLLAHLAGRPAAAAITFLFVCFETANAGQLIASHRWDSAAAALGAVMLAFRAMGGGGRGSAAASGAMAALAAWITPSVVTIVMALAAWLAWRADMRPALRWYLEGAAVISAFFVAVLTAQGALLPMIQHMLWAAANYSSANRVPYGWIYGGYGAIFQDAGAVETALRTWVLLGVAMPALLPPVAAVGWPWRIRRVDDGRRRAAGFLLVCCAAFLVSTYPTWGVGHLTFVAAIFYVTAGWLLVEILPAPARLGLFTLLAILGASFLWNSVSPANRGVRVTTRVGALRSHSDDAGRIRQLTEAVRPGDTLFVFPYNPIVYFLTGGSNPTFYSFLQPGMMTVQDEARALADLQARPPQWVYLAEMPPEAYLRIWPNSDRARLRMDGIEAFIRGAYRPWAESPGHRTEYRLLRLAR